MHGAWKTWVTCLLVAGAFGSAHADDRQDLLKSVGIPPAKGMRGQMDAVGFVPGASQRDSVTIQAYGLASARNRELMQANGWNGSEAFSAAVCPHDDYYYASRLYALLVHRIHAKRVILFGVFHKARVFGCRDRLVFDSFRTWRGPYGTVQVSPLREELLARLPKDHVVVDNDMQQVEHSVESIVPWLQAFNRDVDLSRRRQTRSNIEWAKRHLLVATV